MKHVLPTNPTPRAALLTPRGRGAVATVRLTGPGGIIDEGESPLFRSASGRRIAEHGLGRVIYGHWGAEPAEDVVVCRADETTIDVHCHGGDAASARILDDLRAAGCVVESWQEMTAAAAGVFETELAEALSRTVTLRTAERVLEQKAGLLRSCLEDLQVFLRSLELPAADGAPAKALSRIDELLGRAEFGLHLTQPWRVVIAGRPNAGKSSLINALLGYARSIVFDEPGTTRDVVTAQTAFDGWPIELADTAGIRESADELESEGIERARKQLAEADCRVLLFDLSRRRSPEEEQLLAEWPDALLVGAKRDVPNVWGFPLPAGILRVSAVAGTGLEELAHTIVERLIPIVPAPATPIPVTLRQVGLLKQARTALKSGDLHSAASAVDEILS